MTGMTTAASFQNLQDLLAHVVQSSPAANVKLLAAELECSVELIYQKASPNNSRVFNLRDLSAIVKIYRDSRILDFLVSRMGHLAVADPALEPDMDGSPTDRAAGEVVRDVGELMIAHGEARSVDGPGGAGYTRAEQDVVLDKILTARKSLARFERRVKHEEVVNG